MIPALLALSVSSQVQTDYLSQKGLFISADGIPIVQGSFFQVYAPGWTKGYYSSTWNPQTVTKTPGGLKATFSSNDKRLSGGYTLVSSGDHGSIEYTFKWTGAEPAMLEASIGHLWAPALADATLTLADGVPKRIPAPALATDSLEVRTMGTGRSFKFAAPWGELVLEMRTHDARLFDARNYAQDFAEGKDLFWLGVSDIPLPHGRELKIAVDWKVTRTANPKSPQQAALEPLWTHKHAAYGPFEGILPAVVPKRETQDTGRPWLLGNKSAGIHSNALGRLRKLAMMRWSGWKEGESAAAKLQIKSIGLEPGGYRLKSSDGTLTLIGQDQEGLRNAIERAGTLLRPIDGFLGIPPIDIEDEPEVHWRGVHAFIGPQAARFQAKLIDRLWRPLMLNNIVLQCERTQWDATPNQQGGITTTKDDLKRLAQSYRSNGIEVTPLIQSFGHMEWLFSGKKNLDLAFNRDVPYSIDPRNPNSARKLHEIWDEAVALLKPKTLHFGLDEVDMRGWPEDPQLVTDLWKLQIPILAEIAKKHGARMMLWGDHLLGPGEAQDAMNGHTKAHAKARRDVLPRDAIIADWHYKNDANPAIYTSLGLFKSEGLESIASTWYRPDNVKGFFKAAALNGSGALQTTWAGYESNERNMLEQAAQYRSWAHGPLVAWRPSKPTADPAEVLRRYVYDAPVPVGALGGVSLRPGSLTRIGSFQVQVSESIPFKCVLSSQGITAPSRLVIPVNHAASGVLIALSCENRVDNMTEVAHVGVEQAKGNHGHSVYYGAHLTATSDSAIPVICPQANGIAVFHIPLDPSEQVESVSIEAVSTIAGLKLRGLTLIDPVKRP